MSAPSPRQIERFIVKTLCQELDVSYESVDVDATFSELGLDSVVVVSMSGAVEEWLSIEVKPVLVYNHPSIRELACALGELVATGAAAS